MQASWQDRSLGMEYYITDIPGCGGRIRSIPEDFSVQEVYRDAGYEGGRYLVLEVEKKDWDTHRLIREMARQLRISQRRFGWAGTKDKRALTAQRVSIMNLDESELERVQLPDLRIRVLGRTNRAVGLGDLKGNLFRIIVRDLESPGPQDRIGQITAQIGSFRGVPNYFGVQRFGEIRPVTHRVGEALVRGDPEKAVLIYLAEPFPGEPEGTREARTMLWESRDIPAALRRFPKHLHYELAVMNYLVEHPGEYSHAFQVLPENLRRLFVHAYQSYLFNRILSRRLEAGLPLDRPVEGDVVCFSTDGLPEIGRLQRVAQSNIEAVNRLAVRGRAFVVLPLIGYETVLSAGIQGEIERAVLEEEGLGPLDFRVTSGPGLGSRGTWRAALLPVTPSVDLQGSSAALEFFLPKGGYATVVLREYMKSATVIHEQAGG